MEKKRVPTERDLFEQVQRQGKSETNRNISIHISDRSHYNLTFNIYNCGNQDIAMEHTGKPDHYILYFVKEGRGSVTVRQVTHKVEAGQGFVMFPHEVTQIKPHYKSGMNATWVAFSGYLVERYLSRANLTVYEPVFVDSPEGAAEKMFDTLLFCSTQFPNRYCKMMAQLYSIFGFLLDNIVRETKPDAATPEFYLVRTLDFIDTNYHENISIEEIASSLGLTRKALTMAFASLTGFSPKDYLTYYRITKAVDLLRDANLSIEMIAASVGYNDQFYFSKQFKKNVGMTPSMCRKKVMEDPDWKYESPIDAVQQQYRTPLVTEVPLEF